MSNDSAGRTPRSTAGGAPMGSTVAIVVTAVAVILGFLILKKVNDDGDGGSTTPGTTSTTVDPNNTTSTIDLNTTTSAPVLQKTGTKVQVANAASITGVAKQMSTALATDGFDMADPTNSTGATLSQSKVIYNSTDPNGLAVAQAVAAELGNIPVEQSPAAPPTKSGAFAEGSGVILLLGTDLAGKTLEQIQGGGGTTTTVQVTAVPPAST